MSERLHIGYVLKQYPRLSETFILNEIIGVERAGAEVSVFSLRHATEGRFHPGVAEVRAAVHYSADVDKTSAFAALRALPDLDLDRLADVMAFVERLEPERRARTLISAIEVAHRVRTAGIDHLHAHFLTIAAHTAHIAHLLTGVSYTVTAHAKDIYRYTVDWGLAACVASSAAAVVTVCDANLRYLAARLDGSGARLVRIFNGLGPQDPHTGLDARQRGLVLGVGRLVEKKGFDVLIDAVSAMVAQGSDVRAVLIGDGDQRPALVERAARRGVADRVEFLGAQPQHAVHAWMRRAHVLAAPCRVGSDGNQDALPTVLIEALAAGLPAVSTPVAGIPEIITDGEHGLLVDDECPAVLADALHTLMGDDARWAAMSAAGPLRMRSRFDRDVTIAELVATFRSAASEEMVS